MESIWNTDINEKNLLLFNFYSQIKIYQTKFIKNFN